MVKKLTTMQLTVNLGMSVNIKHFKIISRIIMITLYQGISDF